MGGTYEAAFIFASVLLPLLEVADHCHLHLGVVVLITVTFVGDTLLRDLLVVHGVGGLVDVGGA